VNQGVLLSLLAALVFGGYLVFVKRYFGHYPPTLFVALVNASALAWSLPIAVATVPASGYLPDSLDPAGLAVLLGTAAFTAVALVTFLRALAVGDVSYVAPLSKLVPVFVLPLEVVLLGERLSELQIAGVGVATVAVYVANYRADGLVTPLRRAATNRAAGFALLSAATFGVVDVGKRLSMQELGVPAGTFVPIMLGTVCLLVAPLAVRRRGAVAFRADRAKIVGMGLLAAVAQHLTAMAFETQPASVVSPLVNTQAIVAVVLGSLLLGESYVRIRLLAAALALCGIALISVG